MKSLSRKQRLLNQINSAEVDRIPMIGGWNLGVRNLASIAGISVAEYLRDPLQGVVQANIALGVDAVVSPIIPTDVDSIRDGQLEEKDFSGREPEELQERAAKIPDTEREVLASFDSRATEDRYRDRFTRLKQRFGEIECVTNVWEAPANFALYFQYGYEAFLAATALYPAEVGKIYWEDGLLARERNKIIVRLMKELDLLPFFFTGHDICVNSGPMCSPEFLREYYWPHAKTSLEPLVESGVRLICHCDGNVMPLVDDMLDAGFSGFQGFQFECGVDPFEIRKRRQDLLFFTGLSVTRTLPFGTPQEVCDEVDYFLDYTDGGRGMFLFSSNVTGVEVPPQNIVAAYQHLAEYEPRMKNSQWRPWPWGIAHPEKSPV
jgi:hypothetical protein